jgi:hypothetical protein
VEEIPRPFDPDELPLEAERSEEDVAWANQLIGVAWTPSAPATKAKGRRGRGKSAKAGAAGPATAGSAAAAASGPGSGALEGRPFRLRGLGRIFRSDHK